MLRKKDWIWGGVIVALIAVIWAISFALAPSPAEGEEAFGGTDGAVTELLEKEHKVEPWFSPIFEPDSGELESGLFALQAALGAGVLGFALGNLRGRAVSRKESAETEIG